MNNNKKDIYILIAILAIAVFFRFYNLNSIPPSLYHDEAMNGNDVIQAMDNDTYPKVFYSNNGGREGLFIDIQGLSIKILGHTPLALRIVSVIFGVLTVWGLYLLAKELFDANIAALSSFFLAISFWHVNLSRIGFRAIMLPFILVFEFYFLWRAFKSDKIKDFIFAGIFAGLGFYTYISYRFSLLILILIFLSYRKINTKNLPLNRFVVFAATTIIVALPLLIFFLNHPGELLGRATTDISIFKQSHPLYKFLENTVKTLGMFNFRGDFIWRHNISKSPELVWPMGIFFVIGFIRELASWLKKHDNWSPNNTLLFSWFFVMLLPGFLSVPAPHALRTIGVVPVVMIFAGKGLWWTYDKFRQKYSWFRNILVVLLVSLALVEFWRYQVVWGQNVQVKDEFRENYVYVTSYINKLPKDVPKYIIVNMVGTLVPIPDDPDGRSIPAPAQTVMFLTDTFSYQKQIKKKMFYLTAEEFNKIGSSQKDAIVIYFKSQETEHKKIYSPVILSNPPGLKISSAKTFFIILKEPD